MVEHMIHSELNSLPTSAPPPRPSWCTPRALKEDRLPVVMCPTPGRDREAEASPELETPEVLSKVDGRTLKLQVARGTHCHAGLASSTGLIVLLVTFVTAGGFFIVRNAHPDADIGKPRSKAATEAPAIGGRVGRTAITHESVATFTEPPRSSGSYDLLVPADDANYARDQHRNETSSMGLSIAQDANTSDEAVMVDGESGDGASTSEQTTLSTATAEAAVGIPPSRVHRTTTTDSSVGALAAFDSSLETGVGTNDHLSEGARAGNLQPSLRGVTRRNPPSKVKWYAYAAYVFSVATGVAWAAVGVKECRARRG